MKLQEFLTFKHTCPICNSQIEFHATDLTDISTPIDMHLNLLYKVHDFVKLSHSELSIFISLKKNIYTLLPNADKKINLVIRGVCSKNRDHYSFQSQVLEFHHVAETWGILPDIIAEEIPSISNG